MNLLGRVSNKRVFAAIRYLDPDLPAGWNDAKGRNPNGRCTGYLDFAAISVGIVLGMFVDTQQES